LRWTPDGRRRASKTKNADSAGYVRARAARAKSWLRSTVPRVERRRRPNRAVRNQADCLSNSGSCTPALIDVEAVHTRVSRCPAVYDAPASYRSRFDDDRLSDNVGRREFSWCFSVRRRHGAGDRNRVGCGVRILGCEAPLDSRVHGALAPTLNHSPRVQNVCARRGHYVGRGTRSAAEDVTVTEQLTGSINAMFLFARRWFREISKIGLSRAREFIRVASANA